MPSMRVEPESELALVHPALVFFCKDFSQFGLIQAGGSNINKQKHNNDCLLLIVLYEQKIITIT